MSDLLIKDMPLPDKLAGHIIELAENVDGALYARLSPGFDNWHQVYNISSHGRLIDADEMMEKAQETCCFRGDYALLLNDVVEECTTIVPES